MSQLPKKSEHDKRVIEALVRKVRAYLAGWLARIDEISQRNDIIHHA